jgi:hypothetical protein
MIVFLMTTAAAALQEHLRIFFASPASLFDSCVGRPRDISHHHDDPLGTIFFVSSQL